MTPTAPPDILVMMFPRLLVETNMPPTIIPRPARIYPQANKGAKTSGAKTPLDPNH